jgi:F-type H+-transporting ATPase subunit b
MNLNLTLIGEMITFAVLVWVMMRYIWPPFLKIIEERQKKIIAGIEAAEQGKIELEKARLSADKQLNQAKVRVTALLEQANCKANDLLISCKNSAMIDRDNILAQAKLDLEREVDKARLNLQEEATDLIIMAIEKILQQKIDNKTHKKLIDSLIANI